MRAITLALLVFSMAPFLAAEGPNPLTAADESQTLDRIYREALVNGQAYGHLKELVAKYPGRLSGSDSLAGAVQWGVHTMASLGFDNVHAQPVTVPHWVRGPEESVRIAGVSGPEGVLTATALGGCAATLEEGLTAEVVEVQSLADLPKLGEPGLKGKMVFFNRPMDPADRSPGHAYALAGDQRNHGPGAASRFGAVAALTRSLTQSEDDVPHTGTTSFAAGDTRIPAAALSTVASDHLSRALAANPHLRVTIAIHSQLLPDTPSANVIGEIRGSERPDEVLLVGGHLDSWDIAPGANDDGTGIVQSIEVLRLFKALQIKPRHTIRCVLFVNEENGSRGAAAYRDYAAKAPERHLFAIETDNGGFDPKGFRVGNRNGDAAQRIARWNSLFARYGIWDIQNGGGGADVTPLAALGVTVGGLSPDSQRYFDYHHSRSDSIDKVNPRELHLGAAALASLIWLVDQEGL